MKRRQRKKRTRSPERARHDKRKSDSRPSPALRALTSSALALCSLSNQAQADAPRSDVYADYNYSRYVEDDLPFSRGLPLAASRERYEIDIHQFTLLAPITKRMELGVEIVSESMSGASPWYVVPDGVGTPIQVMSGATIEETRRDLLVSTSLFFENGRLGLSSGHSAENDYKSIHLGLDAETHFNEKNTTLSGGVSFSMDDIDPTDADLFPTRPGSESKDSRTFHIGLSQLLGRHASVQTSLAYKLSEGYLDDPYKMVFVQGGSPFVADRRPGERRQLSWLTRYRRHVEEVNGSLHLDYRFHIDDWEIDSHTIELAWHQSIGDALRVVPSARYYTQNAADFYVPFLLTPPADGALHSNDYRLSAYGAVTFGLKAEYEFRTPWTQDAKWRVTLSWERYFSSSDLSHKPPAIRSPGLVSFNVLTIGIKVGF